MRLKHTDSVFRLKRDNKNLHSSEYSENLIKYLGTAPKEAHLSMNDLSDAIKKITGNYIDSQEKSSTESNDNLPKPGEHVAVFWVERENEVVWYLGIVNQISKNKNVSIMHLKRTDKNGQYWYVPGEDQIWWVDEEQIIRQNLSVM